MREVRIMVVKWKSLCRSDSTDLSSSDLW